MRQKDELIQYTPEYLEALPNRGLDGVVAEIVMDYRRVFSNGILYSIAYLLPPGCPLPAGAEEACHFDNVDRFDLSLVPLFASEWQGLGLIVERMRDLRPGWRFSLLGGDTEITGSGRITPSFGWQAEWFGDADPKKNFGQRHASVRAATPFRAVAIAAVLAARQATVKFHNG